MIELYERDIKDEIQVCTYCGNDWLEKHDVYGCCGEVHPSNAIVTWSDDIYLPDEYIVIEEHLTRKDKDDILGDLQLDIEKDK